MARNLSRFDPGKAFLFFGKCGCAENAEWGVRDGPKFGSSQHNRGFFLLSAAQKVFNTYR